MKHLLIAAALFGVAIFLAINNKLSFSADGGGMVSLSDGNPYVEGVQMPSGVSIPAFANQLNDINEQLTRNRPATLGKIRKALESCLPERTPDPTIELMTTFIRLIAEGAQLPEDERGNYVDTRIQAPSQEFERGIAALSEKDQQRAVQILEDRMGDPIALINCNAGWLESLN